MTAALQKSVCTFRSLRRQRRGETPWHDMTRLFFFLFPWVFSHNTRTRTWDILRSHEHAPVATQLPLAVSDGSTQTEDGLPLPRLSPSVMETNTSLHLRKTTQATQGYFWAYKAWSKNSETSVLETAKCEKAELLIYHRYEILLHTCRERQTLKADIFLTPVTTNREKKKIKWKTGKWSK